MACGTFLPTPKSLRLLERKGEINEESTKQIVFYPGDLGVFGLSMQFSLDFTGP